MTQHRDRVEDVFRSLRKSGLKTAEVYLKSGRSRRLEVDLQGHTGGEIKEQGWAVRAGNPRASVLVAGTGLPSPATDWPEPDGQALRLPPTVDGPEWVPPTDLDQPLVAENEAVAILEGLNRALQAELPGSRLLRASLQEGSSETSIFNTVGLQADYRRRAANLFVEAVGPWPATSSCQLNLAERDHRSFQPRAVARRLANRLLLTREGGAPSRERGEMLLSSAVAARVLVSLLPILIGRQGVERARRLRNRQGRIASRHLTVIDDGRLRGGVLATPVDGEGQPTGRRVLVEEGSFRGPLVDWREVRDPFPISTGCIRREGWRDLPRVGPSHLYIEPRDEVSVADLLGSIARGAYLVEPLGAGRFDFQENRFRLPVCGFVLRQGAATAPLSKVWLEGGIQSFLAGIQAVARDLSFEPLGAMIGAPSLLVGGLGLRPADAA